MVKLAKETRRSVSWLTLGLPPAVGRGARFTINGDRKDLACQALDRGYDYYQAFEGFDNQYYGMWWWLCIVTVTRFQRIPLFHCLAIVLYLQLMIDDPRRKR